MNGVIVYQSKYGATKKYADWLSEETGFPTVETKKAKIDEIARYDTILFGGGIYASGIAGLSFLRKHFEALQAKKILMFCVGASPYEEAAFQEIMRHNRKGSLGQIPCVYCRGVFDMDAMNVVDRNLCKMLRKSVAKKQPEDYAAWEKALMAAGDGRCDWTDKKYIGKLLEMLQ